MYQKYQQSDALLGIIFVLIHAAAVSATYILSKNLAAVIHPEQVAFLYKFGVLVTVIPWCFKCGLKYAMFTKKIWLHFVRAAFSIVANIFFVYGLKEMPTMDAAAMTFLEPIPVFLIGALYFKESMTLSKMILIVCGVVGVFFVIRPGFEEFNKGYIFLLCALGLWGFNNISIKILGKTEKTITQLVYNTLFGSILSLPLAMRYSWALLNVVHIKYVAILTILHLIHIITFFRAFKFADVSTIMPFDYSRLVFSGIFAYIIFDEIPTMSSLIGYIIIMGGSLYVIFDETKKIGKYSATKAVLESENRI